MYLCNCRICVTASSYLFFCVWTSQLHSNHAGLSPFSLATCSSPFSLIRVRGDYLSHPIWQPLFLSLESYSSSNIILTWIEIWFHLYSRTKMKMITNQVDCRMNWSWTGKPKLCKLLGCGGDFYLNQVWVSQLKTVSHNGICHTRRCTYYFTYDGHIGWSLAN